LHLSQWISELSTLFLLLLLLTTIFGESVAAHCFLQIGTNNNNSDFFITLILELQESLEKMAAAATQLQQLHRAALD
jgi:hypothetical protein